VLSWQQKIGEVMTECPRTIPQGTPLGEVLTLLRQLDVRHLPVLNDSGTTVGIVSERDLELAERSNAYLNVRVRDVMTHDPYCVPKEESLREVVHVMANRKYGCVIVENDKRQPIGIFTAVDALLLLDVFLGEGSSPLKTR
jgi:predicted transcriptional regulator